MVQNLQKLNRVAQKKKVVIARGVLSVTVISAEDLPPADLMGKANPFVILTLKKSGTKNKSRVVNDSLNSVWNQSFDFIVEDGLHEMLIVEVWDHDTFGKHIRTRMHPPLPLPCQLQLISLLCHLYFFPALALSRMSRQYKSIKEITIGTRGWTCKVLVAEKAMPRTSRNSPVRYQHLILIDHEGTRIQATIFADAI